MKLEINKDGSIITVREGLGIDKDRFEYINKRVKEVASERSNTLDKLEKLTDGLSNEESAWAIFLLGYLRRKNEQHIRAKRG